MKKSSKSRLIRKICGFAYKCEYDEFILQLKKLGFKHLGQGCSRIAYGNGKLVVKINESMDDENWIEYKFWKNITRRKYGKLLVAPILKYYNNKNSQLCASLLFSVQCKKRNFYYLNKKEQYNILYKMFNDVHESNVMEIGGALVIIDLNCECRGWLNITKNLYDKWKSCINLSRYKKALKVAVSRALVC